MTDSLDEEGAHKLRAQIIKFWRDKGKSPIVDIIPVLTNKGFRTAFHYAIRSDMKNGQPV